MLMQIAGPFDNTWNDTMLRPSAGSRYSAGTEAAAHLGFRDLLSSCDLPSLRSVETLSQDLHVQKGEVLLAETGGQCCEFPDILVLA